MKTTIFTIAVMLMSLLVKGQVTQTENYLKTTTYKVETQNGTTNANTNTTLTNDEKIEQVSYFDGLGRTKQNIAVKAGGNGEDIITHFQYDQLGRQSKEFLPFANNTTNGAFNNNALSQLQNFYNIPKYENTTNPYSEMHYEDSPLNRVLEQGAPGLDWKVNHLSNADHTVKFNHGANLAGEVKNYEVNLYFANNTYNPTLVLNGNYPAHQLQKTVTKDENWTSGNNNTVQEFIDKQGQVILKRAFNNNQSHDTFYVYDDYGNLTYVLPPKAEAGSGLSNAIELSELCYQYKYDHKNRLVAKKLPGKDWEYIIYNKLDQPVMTQDANLRVQKKWLFTTYDTFGRVAYTGEMHFNNYLPSREMLQLSFLASSGDQYVTKTNTPISIAGTNVYYTLTNTLSYYISKIYTINYYDNYNWDTVDTFEASGSLATQSGVSVSGSAIYKTTSNSWSNAGFTSAKQLEGDGYVQFKPAQTNKRYMIGLSRTDSAPNNSYNTIDYAIYVYSNGRLYIYEEGSFKSIPTTYYQAGDILKIERLGDRIFYKKNNVTFYTSQTLSTGTLLGDSSFYDGGSSISDFLVGHSAMGQAFNTDVKGLPTGSKVRVLDTNDWITTATYYDDKGRIIFVNSNNDYLDIKENTSNKLDFIGNVVKSKNTHQLATNTPIITEDTFSYDHSNRVIRQTQKIDKNTEELIVKNNYDDLGQLTQKQVGGSLEGSQTYTNISGVSVVGNAITKTASYSWSNAGLSSSTNISGDGYLSFTAVTTNKAFMAGLSYYDVNQHYNTIKYAVYLMSNGNVQVRESGSSKGIKTKYTTGDVFKIERRGSKIYYNKNDEVFYVSTTTTTNSSMVGDLSMYHPNAKISDFTIVDLEQGLQEVDLTYNVRGWLKGINDPNNLGNDLFGFKINYNFTDMPSSTALYNGNISETVWKSANDVASKPSNFNRGYSYKYDHLNRITRADYKQKASNGIYYASNYIEYTVNNISYDKNGNINGLRRYGNHLYYPIDVLTYTYDSGNKLLKVADNGYYAFKNEGFKDGTNMGYDYTYDANGNLKSDKNKAITNINYNYLNLPIKVSVNGTAPNQGYIQYSYDATGAKQRKLALQYGTTITTEYAGNFVYQKNGSQNKTLKFMNTAEGYVEPNNQGGYNYVYQYKDHLGNVRLTYSDSNGNGTIESDSEIIEENNFYPFGLQHKGYNNIVSANANSVAKNFKYNGKELEESLELHLYEYGARMYNPAIARFTSIDPLTEDYISQSVYVYAANNPIFFQEKNGESPDTIYVSESGEVIADIDDGSDAVYVVTDGNEEALVEELIEENITNDSQDAEINAEIGEKYGFNITELKYNARRTGYPKGGREEIYEYSDWNFYFESMYKAVYTNDKSKIRKNKMMSVVEALAPGKGGDISVGVIAGETVASRHLRNNRMNMFNPQIKSGSPKYDFCSMINSARNARAAANNYTIQRGDNLTHIARDNNTTVGSLVKLNNIKNPDLIYTGNKLKLK